MECDCSPAKRRKISHANQVSHSESNKDTNLPSPNESTNTGLACMDESHATCGRTEISNTEVVVNQNDAFDDRKECFSDSSRIDHFDPEKESNDSENKMVIEGSTTDATEESGSQVKNEESLPPQVLGSGGENVHLHSRKKLLVLDVNGLIVDIVADPDEALKPDTRIGSKALFKRPFCDDFLKFCFERFSVGVWTSRTRWNIKRVLDFVMKDTQHQLVFCWDQSHCTETGFNTIENSDKPLVLKELKKLWEKQDPNLPWDRGVYDESNTLLLDDSPYKALCNPPCTAIFPYTYSYRDTQDSGLVFKRPYCDDFLQFCFKRFNVGVWTSTTRYNTEQDIDFLMRHTQHRLLFCWDVNHCTDTGFSSVENSRRRLLLKELRKLWAKEDPNLPWESGEYDESNTLLVDNAPHEALLNPPHTAIFPYPYHYYNTEDNSLGPKGDLRIYLERLAASENVQKFVSENPFGQRPIREKNLSWAYYQKVIQAVTSRRKARENNSVDAQCKNSSKPKPEATISSVTKTLKTDTSAVSAAPTLLEPKPDSANTSTDHTLVEPETNTTTTIVGQTLLESNSDTSTVLTAPTLLEQKPNSTTTSSAHTLVEPEADSTTVMVGQTVLEAVTDTATASGAQTLVEPETDATAAMVGRTLLEPVSDPTTVLAPQTLLESESITTTALPTPTVLEPETETTTLVALTSLEPKTDTTSVSAIPTFSEPKTDAPTVSVAPTFLEPKTDATVSAAPTFLEPKPDSTTTSSMQPETDTTTVSAAPTLLEQETDTTAASGSQI